MDNKCQLAEICTVPCSDAVCSVPHTWRPPRFIVFFHRIVFTKKLLQWYFRRKIERKNEELTDLIKQKRSVLDNVMETETYKVAKEILEKYDPETLRKSVVSTKISVGNRGRPVAMYSFIPKQLCDACSWKN